MKKTAIFIVITFILAILAIGYFLYPVITQPPEDITEIINTTGMPLNLPKNFSIEIFAKNLPNARVMAFDYSGNMLVSQTKEGQVSHLTIQNGKVTNQKTLIDDLNNPHGIAFLCDPIMVAKPIECQLYIAEEDQITRYDYDMLTATTGNQTKIADLPGGGDDHSHFTRTIAFGPDERLYIATGSSCDVCEEEDPMRATIYSMNPDGSDKKLYAGGLRNSVFFTWSYVDGRLWATEMGRDNLGDDLPPDEINIIEEGKNYGWPYCYGKNIHDEDFDQEANVRGRCENTIPSYVDLQAHSAPLGLSFIPEEGWPEEYWYNLFIAYHGSWNRTMPTGYKVIRIILDAEGNYLGTEDFITGWLDENGAALGRPVDLLIQPGGMLYISDDKAGVIYKVTYSPDTDAISNSDTTDPTVDFSNKIYNDLLLLDSPLENDYIKSPLIISGSARGPMYFEAVFRVAVKDANGKELGSGIAQAISNWMTEDFVPFAGKINYDPPSTPSGYLIFEKANASGLPEHDLTISIPIIFGDF